MADDQLDDKTVKSIGNPLIFISHDTRDAELAEAFSNLLKSVSAGVLKSFRTSDRRGNQGIEYGVEWYPEIIKNIQDATDVVCLLTKRSIDRPWILFEAGMAKGKLDTPILGVALGIELRDASSGPFAQFQNCSDDEEALTKLVFQLVKRIPNSEPDTDTIKFQVGKFKNSITQIIEKLDGATANDITKKSANTKEIENSSAKLFEEIKIMFQDLPSRIEKNSPYENRKRKRRFHPGMLEEIMHVSKDYKIGIRVALSFYKEKLPWIYDEGIILIKKIDSLQTTTAGINYLNSFSELLMLNSKNPYLKELFMDDEEDYFIFRELPKLIMHSVERYVSQKSAEFSLK
jgi:TIR domain